MDDHSLSHIFEDTHTHTHLGGVGDDYLLSILDALDDFSHFPAVDIVSPEGCSHETSRLVSQKSTSESDLLQTSPKSNKRRKVAGSETASEEPNQDGQPKISHITVERNRRKQMNHHLSVLRSLMPSFYVKRGDQASIIGGVVDYINELQQLVQSLEAKKQRKVYTEVLSPRGLVPSPRVISPSPLSPRKGPVSPRLNLPISPRTPQAGAGRLMSNSHSHSHSVEPSPTSSANSCSINDNINELVANSKSPIADVEVKFSGPHLVLKTLSPPIPGQPLKIISALQDLALEILHLTISTAHETMLNSFTIKIGIECQLSAEDLAQQVQQTFYQPY